jgi:hypothetical protein
VLEKWLREVALPTVGDNSAEVMSGISLCVVVPLLTIVNSGLIRAGQLATAIGRHLSLHKAAYGLDLWLPKTHFTIHLPDILRRHKCLLSTFVQERKHRHVKVTAEGRHTTVSYNRGLMEEITLAHLYQLKDPLTKPTLLNPKAATKKVRATLASTSNDIHNGIEVFTSRDAHVHCRVVHVGDVVAFRSDNVVEFGPVLFHASIGGELSTCIHRWQVVESQPTWAKCVVSQNNICLVDTQSLIEPCVFWPSPQGSISHVLLPPRLKLGALL